MDEISDEIGIFFTRNHLGHIGYWPFEAGNRLLLNNQIDVKIFTGDISAHASPVFSPAKSEQKKTKIRPVRDDIINSARDVSFHCTRLLFQTR